MAVLLAVPSIASPALRAFKPVQRSANYIDDGVARLAAAVERGEKEQHPATKAHGAILFLGDGMSIGRWQRNFHLTYSRGTTLSCS